ncbi:serine hydrolase domain-containing protein [Carboxylicivirga sp. N1Y90]|uniref:serine hydrolase domain-containing protein n=1 Tax=Carboxylicivirga fragile TaxID=3417571 RepID=UPI003D337DED|nr:beta-lactamase family protein [Marinilabiliaceae bacterium N1Y90]
MKIIVFGLLLIITQLNCISQETVFRDSIINKAMTSFKNKWKIPGLSVAMAKDGRLVYANGFGYADTLNKIPVTPESKFRTASCGKTITAIGIMKLVEEGKLDLNDRVFGRNGLLNGDTYSEIADKRVYDITVKNLLQQTIGWPEIDIIGENYAAYALHSPIPAGINENARYILSQKLEFSPSKDYRYSDFNYLFLGEIISELTQQNHTDYIITNILHPIGAYNTLPAKSTLEEREENEVIYYDYNQETLPFAFDTSKIVPMSYSFNFQPMISSGGWISTPIDMIKLILAIDGLDNRKDILKSETIKLMTSTPDGIKSRYAMGMKVTKSGWRHSGQCTWGTSAIWIKTNENICLAITCNTLPTVKGTEEVKYEAIIEHLIDMIKLIPEKLGGITKYPDIDLFTVN